MDTATKLPSVIGAFDIWTTANLPSITATLMAILVGTFLFLKFLRTWELRSERQFRIEEYKLEIERSRLDKEKEDYESRNQINIDNSRRDLPENDIDNSGFFFFDVDDSRKRMFVDALMGFEDYAMLKGYDVTVHINTAVHGKVGMKIVINDIGFTVSRETVKRDATDFIKKVLTDDDFSDIPVIDDPTQHYAIINALVARNKLLQERAKISAESAASYRELLTEVREFAKVAVTYSKPPDAQYIQIEAQGGSAMHDKMVNKNSPGSAVGKGITYTGNTINVGLTATERADRVAALGDLISAVQQSELSASNKEKVTRYLGNAKEEVNVSGEPDKDSIGKWLGRAKSIIDIGEAAPALIESAKKVFDMFGDSSTWPGLTA